MGGMSTDSSNDFPLNCIVQFKAGNFRGHIGHIHSLDASKQVAVALISIHDRTTPVEVALGDLEEIQEPAGFKRANLGCQTQ